MPTVPKQTKCSQLGCKNSRSRMNAYCLNHGGRDYTINIKRTIGKELYSSQAWRTIRRQELSRQPLCQSCLLRGRVEMAKEVDHLFAWSQLGNEAFRNNIFQCLCQPCHSVKTNLEQKGIYRHYAEKVTDYAIQDYQRVLKSTVVSSSTLP